PGGRVIRSPADDRAGGGGDGGAVLPHLDAGARGDGSSGEDGDDSAGAAGDTDKIVLVGVILRDTGNSGTGGGGGYGDVAVAHGAGVGDEGLTAHRSGGHCGQ